MIPEESERAHNVTSTQTTEERAAQREQQRAVAQTILNQLGGRQFMGMTGAKGLTVVDEKLGGLAMKLPQDVVRSLGPKGVNFVTVVLDYNDTYCMTFAKVRGTKLDVVSYFDNMYCDDLQDIFERETGLLVSLFPRR